MRSSRWCTPLSSLIWAFLVLAAGPAHAVLTNYVSGSYTHECFSYRLVFCSPQPFQGLIPQGPAYSYDQTYQGTTSGNDFTSSALARLTFEVTPNALTVAEVDRASYTGTPAADDVAGAVSLVEADVADLVHFDSSTLPVGTPVSFQFYSWLDTHIQQNVPCNVYGGAHAYVVVSGFQDLSLYHDNCGNGTSHMEASVTLASTVGGSFGWTAQYAAATSAFLSFGSVPNGSADARRSINGPLDPDVNALYFQVLTPGVTLRSDSGATYALPAPPAPPSAAPEPRPLALLLAAGVGLAALRSRGATGCRRSG